MLRDNVFAISVYFDNELLQKIHQMTEKIAEDVSRNEIVFNSIDSFGSKVIYLRPIKSQWLASNNRKVHDFLFQKFETADEGNYLPANWIPHCALAVKMSETEFTEAMGESKLFDLPIKGTIESVVLAKCNPYREVGKFII